MELCAGLVPVHWCLHRRRHCRRRTRDWRRVGDHLRYLGRRTRAVWVHVPSPSSGDLHLRRAGLPTADRRNHRYRTGWTRCRIPLWSRPRAQLCQSGSGDDPLVAEGRRHRAYAAGRLLELAHPDVGTCLAAASHSAAGVQVGSRQPSLSSPCFHRYGSLTSSSSTHRTLWPWDSRCSRWVARCATSGLARVC